MQRITSRLTYANVMATAAVFIALGGSSYAAVKIGKNTVGATQIKTGAVRSSEVKDGTLLGKDFKSSELAKLKGAKGDKGDTGATGAQGIPGPATGAASGVLGGSYPGPAFAAGVDEVIPVAIAATNTDGTLRNEAHRAPATGAVAPSRSSAGIYDFAVPGVTFGSTTDVATCTPGEANISVDVESIGGNTLRVFTFNAATGAATDSQLYCVIYENS